MKKYNIALIAIILIAVAACASPATTQASIPLTKTAPAQSPAPTPPPTPAPSPKSTPTAPTKTSKILSVKDIAADPSAYQGTITITGVVSVQLTSEPNVFLLIETQEALLCKSVQCANFYLPVKYDGKMPKMADEVNVTGKFVQSGQRFAAEKVDVLRHLNF